MQQLLIKQPNIVPAVYINAYIVYYVSMPVCERKHTCVLCMSVRLYVCVSMCEFVCS